MKKLRWVIAGVVLVAMVYAWQERARRADAGELVAAYARATCVPPHARPRDSSGRTYRAWDETFDLGSGVSVRIDAACSVGGGVGGRYSDEPTPRTLASPGDDVYPCDLRIDWMQMRLYVRAQGLSSGFFERTELYEYDLQARRSPRQAVVEPTILPPQCDIRRRGCHATPTGERHRPAGVIRTRGRQIIRVS